MKAAVLSSIGRPLEIWDVPIPKLESDEVLIETRTCGICRTDLHIQQGLAYVPSLPHIPGHEAAGVIVDAGSDIDACRIGERVVPHLFVRGSDCQYSRRGDDALALDLRQIIGVTSPGGFAEYFKAPARNLLTLPENVSFAAGGLVSCAVVTAVRSFRRARLRLGDSLIVLGAGGIGQMVLQLAHHAGIRTLAVDTNEAARHEALKNHAAHAVDPADPDIAENILQFAQSDGVDVVMEFVGRAQTMSRAAQWVRRGGRIVVVGEEAEFPAIDTIAIAQKELEIIGSRNGGIQDAIDALALISRGILDPPIAARFSLDEINEAFTALEHGTSSGRVVINIRFETAHHIDPATGARST